MTRRSLNTTTATTAAARTRKTTTTTRRRTRTTKSGKYVRNPTDQARKEARKREVMKIKKRRIALRQAILKSKDALQLLEEASMYDKQEYDWSVQSSQLNEHVLQAKRKRLLETFDKIICLYKKEDPEYAKDLVRARKVYDKCRHDMMLYYEQVKLAERTKASDNIPLPPPPPPPRPPRPQLDLPPQPTPKPPPTPPPTPAPPPRPSQVGLNPADITMPMPMSMPMSMPMTHMEWFCMPFHSNKGILENKPPTPTPPPQEPPPRSMPGPPTGSVAVARKPPGPPPLPVPDLSDSESEDAADSIQLTASRRQTPPFASNDFI